MPSYSRTVQIPGKTADELYQKISVEIDRFLSKSSLGGAQVERDDEHREVRVKHKMFSAQLACGEASLTVSAQLSLFAAPFRSKLDQGIDQWISKTFSR